MQDQYIVALLDTGRLSEGEASGTVAIVGEGRGCVRELFAWLAH
jgi:hypothetical protein